MSSPPALPDFVAPMLAKIGEPFDSDDHLFEVKWDGMRALTLVDRSELRVHNRNLREVLTRFPELAFLQDLPAGTVLDGELVVTVDGKPDFHATMKREHARAEMRIRHLHATMPASYVVFDLLYEGFEPITGLPLVERRARLQKLVESCADPTLVLSEGIESQGLAMFEHASSQGLEGIVAKRLDSRYLVGQRTDAWLKIKRKQIVHCVVLGFEPAGTNDLKSLIIAMEEDGLLRCVGQVGSGINESMRAELNQWLWSHLREEPVIPCDLDGKWVETGLFCTVSFLERTPNGNLRAPVVVELIKESLRE